MVFSQTEQVTWSRCKTFKLRQSVPACLQMMSSLIPPSVVCLSLSLLLHTCDGVELRQVILSKMGVMEGELNQTHYEVDLPYTWSSCAVACLMSSCLCDGLALSEGLGGDRTCVLATKPSRLPLGMWTVFATPQGKQTNNYIC